MLAEEEVESWLDTNNSCDHRSCFPLQDMPEAARMCPRDMATDFQRCRPCSKDGEWIEDSIRIHYLYKIDDGQNLSQAGGIAETEHGPKG